MSVTPLLIGTDQNQANAVTNMYNNAKTRVQATLTKYSALGLPALVTADFDRLFNDTEGLLFDKITGGSAALVDDQGAALPVDQSAAYALLSKPAGTDILLEDIRQLTIDVIKGWTENQMLLRFTIDSISNYFTLDGAGVLQFTASSSSKIDAAGKIYLNTQKGQDTYAFIQAFITAYYENDMQIQFGWTNDIRGVIDMLKSCTGILKVPDQDIALDLAMIKSYDK